MEPSTLADWSSCEQAHCSFILTLLIGCDMSMAEMFDEVTESRVSRSLCCGVCMMTVEVGVSRKCEGVLVETPVA